MNGDIVLWHQVRSARRQLRWLRKWSSARLAVIFLILAASLWPTSRSHQASSALRVSRKLRVTFFLPKVLQVGSAGASFFVDAVMDTVGLIIGVDDAPYLFGGT